MEPTPKPDPRQHNPSDTTLPTKGTSDTPGPDETNATNTPRPDSVPDAPPAPSAAPVTQPETAENEAAEAATPSADPSAADIQPDTGGDTDPGASNTGDIQPL